MSIASEKWNSCQSQQQISNDFLDENVFCIVADTKGFRKPYCINPVPVPNGYSSHLFKECLTLAEPFKLNPIMLFMSVRSNTNWYLSVFK
jgi:hypothetical protein